MTVGPLGRVGRPCRIGSPTTTMGLSKDGKGERVMTRIGHRSHETGLPDPEFVHPELRAPDTREMVAYRYVAAATRISLGWIFLWAFLDKTFGLGHQTTVARAWVNGGQPTKGFLTAATTGPFAEFYRGLAGNPLVDWLFMIGLLGIGVGLLAGIAMRIAAGAGAALMVMMWSAVLPPANNLFMDDHIIYALVLVGLALVGAGRTLGLGTAWERLPVVVRHPTLR